MTDHPGDANKQHEQYEEDEEPELDGRIVPPPDSSYAVA
jgi:hypothetical protein